MKTQHQFDYSQPVAYNEERKEQFHRNARGALRTLANKLELAPGSYDIRNNAGGIAVSGEVTLHHETFYIQVSQSCVGLPGILLRTVKGRKDYTGGPNNFVSANKLNDLSLLASIVRNFLVTKPVFPMRDL
jgi:hypothetical protein